MYDETNRLLELIESDTPLDMQREIIRLRKLRSAQDWTTSMPLCMPEADGALPKGWMEWMLQVLPVLLEQVTKGLPFARVKSIILPATWVPLTYRFEAPQIGFTLEVSEDPTGIPGLEGIIQQLGWTREISGDSYVRCTFGPGKVVGVDINMSNYAWNLRLRAHAESVAKQVAPAEPPPVANNGSDSEIPS